MKCFTKLRIAAIAVVAVALIGVSGTTALAQSTTEGAIGGLVYDPSAAIAPGATVVARNTGTNSTAEGVSDGNGRFLVIGLAPGVYTVEVTLGAIASYRRENVIVEVGRVTNLDVTLRLGGQTETIQVTVSTPIINLEKSDFSNNINQTQIAYLPTNT